ncbi:MAG: DHH family phosphoesterase [Lachnospiraceae bacterium]|nr:DHH family phosphoesterase [Lachnospiraceae bacterium]
MKNTFLLTRKMSSYLRWPLLLTPVVFVMAVVLAVFDKETIRISLPFVTIYFLTAMIVWTLNKDYIFNDLVNFAMTFGIAQNEVLTSLSIPFGIMNSHYGLVWENDSMKEIISKQYSASKSLKTIMPNLEFPCLPNLEQDVFTRIKYNDKHYRVELRALDLNKLFDDNLWNIRAGFGSPNDDLYTIAFYDETEYVKLNETYNEEKVDIGYLYVDNYEETFNQADEMRRSVATGKLEMAITEFFADTDTIIRKTDKDKFIFIFRHKYLKEFEKDRFDILDTVRNMKGLPGRVTVSIGISQEPADYTSGLEDAKKAIDLALARGGDQAVIRKGTDTRFYGAKTSQNSRNTLAKARLFAFHLRDIIKDSDKVIVMGHSNPDADCLGAAMGIWRIAKTLGTKCHVVTGENMQAIKSLMDRFKDKPDYDNEDFIGEESVTDVITSKSLLIVVDVNRPSRTFMPSITGLFSKGCIIDHHRQTAEADDAFSEKYEFYIEPSASSTSEMIAELCQYINPPVELSELEASAMYAGLMIDTNNLTTKMSARSFEAAAYMRKCGADLTMIRKMFRIDSAEYISRAKVVANAECYRDHYMFAVLPDDLETENASVLASQVGNELMNINSVKGALVFYKTPTGVSISARSIDEFNVQVLMEAFHGGGHMSAAGAQVADATIEEVIMQAKEEVDRMIEGGRR